MAAEVEHNQITVVWQLGAFPSGRRELHLSGGHLDERGAFAKSSRLKLNGGILQQGLRLGDKVPDGCCIQDDGASVVRDDTAHTEAGRRGLDRELMVTALQPCNEVRPERDKDLIGEEPPGPQRWMGGEWRAGPSSRCGLERKSPPTA